jgi:hypothetical protein
MPSTPKTEGGYLTEEEQEEGGDQPQPVEEDDVDEYLYGESDTNTKTPKPITDEDEDMDDEPSSALSVPLLIDDDENIDETRERDSTPRPENNNDTDNVENMVTDDDFEDEIDPTENMQSNQSYWIFGDSLKRFKEASAAVVNSQKDGDKEQCNTHLITAKKSLKEILAVFLRMAIPAETLIPTIGSYVRNMIVSNMLTHQTSLENTQDDDAMLNDPSKDVFDIIMATFWSVRDNDASRDKLVRLIGGIAHNRKGKGRRHIIGMRWWIYIAA